MTASSANKINDLMEQRKRHMRLSYHQATK
jgi:hypothetical protein